MNKATRLAVLLLAGLLCSALANRSWIHGAVAGQAGVNSRVEIPCIAGAPESEHHYAPFIVNNTYQAREGDFNGDGRLDILVTGKPERVVGDFLLIQTDDFEFEVKPSVNNKEREDICDWPLTNISLGREDINGDGHADFFVSNIDEYVDGAYNVIVLTKFREGRTPTMAFAWNERYEDVFVTVERYLDNPHGFKPSIDQAICHELRQVMFAYAPCASGGEGRPGWGYCPMPSVYPGTVCHTVFDFAVNDFMRRSFPHIATQKAMLDAAAEFERRFPTRRLDGLTRSQRIARAAGAATASIMVAERNRQ